MIYIGYTLAAITLLVCLYLLFVESRLGGKKVIALTTFRFPEGLTSADAGTMIDGTANRRDVLSLIPWFAAEGYLRMERTDDVEMELRKDGVKTNFTLYRLADPPTDAPKYIHVFFNTLFPGGSKKRELCYEYDQEFSEGYRETLSYLRHVSTAVNQGPKPIDFGLTIASIVLMALTCALLSTDTTISIIMCIFVLFPLCATMVYMFMIIGDTMGYTGYAKMTLLQIGGYGFYAVALGSYSSNYAPDNWTLCMSLIGVVLLTTVLMPRLARITNHRKAELLGLKQYIAVAEKEELRRIVTDNPTLFYRILAYGMAFGLAKAWLDKFRAFNIMIGDD